MGWIKKIHELMSKTGKSMKEVFAMLPGSMTHYRNEIRRMLKDKPPAFLGAHKYSYIEDILVEQPKDVVIECVDTDYNRKYFMAKLVEKDGQIQWGEGKEIEFTVVPQMKNEMAEMIKFVESAPPPSDQFVEVSDATIEYNESTQTAIVNIAQRAETINRNNRSYPADVLKRAVTEAQQYIETHGSLPIETLHGDVRDINSVCAVIKKIEFDESTGVVSLPEVKILSETTSGKNVLAILKAGEKLQLSQRGLGTAHTETDESTGKEYQKMDYITFQGFDLVWNGEASVADTDFQLAKMPEHIGNPPADGPTLSSVTELIQKAGKDEKITEADIRAALKGVMGTELAPLQKQLESALAEVKDYQLQISRNDFVSKGIEYVNEKLAEAGARFTDGQKDIIRSRIDLDKLSEQYDGKDITAVSRIVDGVLTKEIANMDTILAELGLDKLNLPKGRSGSRYINRAGGLTFDKFVTDLPYDGETFVKTAEAAIKNVTRQTIKEDNLSPEDLWVMPKTHEGMDVLAQILEKFYLENESKVQNEATQAGVGVPVSITSMYIVYVAWRMTSAFQVVQMHTMENLLENIPVEVWTGAHADVAPIEQWMALNPGENVDIPESEWSTRNYPLAASYQPQHTRVTPYVMAVTKGTVMEPVARSIALPARELRDKTDTMLWYIQIMEALKYNSVAVTTAETIARNDSNPAGPYQLQGPIVPYEWVILKDVNDNVASAGFKRLFPANGAGKATGDTDSGELQGTSLTPLEVGDGSANFLYGTDYTVDFIAGTITLTTAGAAKLTSGESLNVKYQRATNMRVWDAMPSAGVSYANHLLGFQRVLADNKADIVDRHYTPECLCWNYRLQEKLALSARFTEEGTNAAHGIDMMNTIARIQGLKPVWSTAIELPYCIVTEMNATLYGVHTPFTMTNSVINDNTGNEHWFAKQFVGAGVPEPKKLSILGLKNVDRL